MFEVKALCPSCIIHDNSLLLISVYLDTFVVSEELRDGVDAFQKLKQRKAHTYFESMELHILYQ